MNVECGVPYSRIDIRREKVTAYTYAIVEIAIISSRAGRIDARITEYDIFACLTIYVPFYSA